MSSAGVYIHIPFCAGKCPYCDFYSVAGSESDYDRYTQALLRAIERAPYPFAADTLYFGGGTPSLLGAERLLAVKDAAARRFGLQNAEITLEANPCSVNPAMLKALTAGGFTRISLGVQSTNNTTLRTLGRRHSAAEAADAIRMAADAGFLHISADLILAVPGQTIDEIRQSVKTLAALPVDHLSAYLLKVESGTPFASRFCDPEENFAADCYLAAVEACAAHEFFQYEISNFAKDTAAQSRHNLHYWRCEAYLGIGSAAHSFAGGKRFYFPRNLALFCAAENPWTLTADDGAGGGEEERILLGLRLSEGIELQALSSERQSQLVQRAAPLLAAGWVVLQSGRLALTVRGFLVSNAVIAALLG